MVGLTSSMAETEVLSVEAASKLFGSMQAAIDASISAVDPLLDRARSRDESLDTAAGLSLLSVRPTQLLASVNHLALRLAIGLSDGQPLGGSVDPVFGSAKDVASLESLSTELDGQLVVGQEVMDKVRNMESKLEYQVKKLSALAEADEKRGKEVDEDVEEDPLSFRPNPLAMQTDKPESRKTSTEEAAPEVYRPPRLAAMPYNEPTEKKRRDRRAPALLSEFASTLEGAPSMQTTSGLSTIPVRSDRHTNSASAKRAAELQRINQFEEENMTRLVTTKREAKRRREDEAALALGYGVGGTGRARGNRQNGLEAELEGVLGERRSKGVWEGVSAKMGARDGVFERGKRNAASATGGQAKKARFEKDVKGRGRK